MYLINYIIVLIQTTTFTIATAPIDVVFIVQNQEIKYQNELSRKLKENIIKQSIELQPNYTIRVHLVDEIFNYPGGWTIHNLIPQLMLFQRKHNTNTNANNKPEDMEVINENTRWIVFCEDKTRVRVKLLMERLNTENHTQPLFLGHPLYDREPTIIHHFAFFENPKWFPYPMLRAGVVLSVPLFKSIAEIYNNNKSNKYLKQQFSIDAAHELARFIYDNIHQPAAISTTSQDEIPENKYHHTHTQTSDTAGYRKKTKTKTFFDVCANSPIPSQVPNEQQQHTTIFNTGAGAAVASNVSAVSHSDFRTLSSNKIIDKHENEITNPSDTATSSSLTKTKSFAKKKKIILKKASYICPVASWESAKRKGNNNNNNEIESCAMYAESVAVTCTPVMPNEIYFAVKTCSKYHNERLPIIQATWAPYAKHVKYFSDLQDDTIPTVYTGVPNVEMGHCKKTLKILKLALSDIEKYNKKHRAQGQQIKWLFLSDDDTILSVSGVCQVLGCCNSMNEIYLGERYGYRLHDQDGFNYITGGGGIAFSLPTVHLILQHCSCPSPTTPDDMILGSCLHSLQLKALHSPRFHQARPNDYPWELLQQEEPVSFHKFWQLDPVDVYRQWFAYRDRQLLSKETLSWGKFNQENHHFKTRKLLAKTESLILKEMPVSMMASLHHSKERHVDL